MGQGDSCDFDQCKNREDWIGYGSERQHYHDRQPDVHDRCDNGDVVNTREDAQLYECQQHQPMKHTNDGRRASTSISDAYVADPDDILDQHVAYYLRHNPDVHSTFI